MPVFCHLYRVTYADCTVGNHVYYGRYLELLESARGEYFRSLGTSFREWQAQGVAFPVIECRLRYRMPAQYDDVLRVELKVSALQGARLNLDYRVCNQDAKLVLEAETFHACSGPTGKPRRVPEALGALLLSAAGPFGKEA
jgi:acyl-CoA thioester hydrolase